ncbi:MAG TPA: CaiB/BaiF CoA-transferase family protein [Acidimicrobiia bacterium]|nr:CaiB/BaiF CoA-transferase family protein [Acidimicrobiia bacterium]
MTRVRSSAVVGPLAGVRVVEMAGIGPIPFAGMMLADLGADVVRVDRMDPGPLSELSTLDPTGRGRRSLVLDLKHPDGREVALRLVAQSQMLIEGFRPGVMERLGLGPDDCLGVNPKLVFGRMTGWGQEGPRAGTAGHDITYLAVTGTLSAIGPAEQPLPPLNLVADYGGGAMLLLVGVLAALDHVRRGGDGQVVDAAMVDGVSLLTAMTRGGLAAGWWEDRRHHNLLDGAAPFYRTYQAAEGGFVAVGALEPQFYLAFVKGLGLEGEDLPDQYDRSRWPALADRIATRIKERTAAEWDEIFAGTDACVVPVHSLTEALSDPHLVARRTFMSAGGLTQPSPAPRFSSTPATTDGLPIGAGSHTYEVLNGLGYTIEEIGKLVEHLVTPG